MKNRERWEYDFFFFTFGFLADICEKSWSLAHLCAEILERERERERGVLKMFIFIRGVVWGWNEGIERKRVFVLFIWVVATNVEWVWVIMSCDWFWGWRVFPTVWLIWSQIICQVFYASMSAKSWLLGHALLFCYHRWVIEIGWPFALEARPTVQTPNYF